MLRILLATTLLVTSAMPAAPASVSRTYSYFSIGGTTLDEIEAELGRRGPQLNGAGPRHPGATRLEFKSKLRFAETRRATRTTCRIDRARVSVSATVVLPRWHARRRADDGTRLIWDTLASDIKRHEESHIGIAKGFARQLEAALQAIPRQPTCAAASERAKAVTAGLLARHDEEQARFDRIESKNFERRVLGLLRYRLERMQGKGGRG